MKDIDGIEDVLKILEPHWREIQADFNNHNARFLELAQADHDLIGRILRAHLVIENFIESFLSSRFEIQDISKLKLSFFQKATLLPAEGSSAAFVRPGILQLNAIRNKFGHRLNHEIERHEISAILEVLAVARKNVVFDTPLSAIEAFAPVACAFLSVAPPHLEKLFVEAFANIRTYSHEE